MKTYSLFTTAFLLAAVTARSQSVTIKGNVYSASNQPLQAVTISLKGTSGSVQSLPTRADGGFEFTGSKKEAVYDLKISSVGYTTIDTLLTVPTEDAITTINLNTIRLASEVKMMKEVVIQSKPKVIELSGNKILFNVSKSPIAAGKSMYDALKQIPGVFEQNNTLTFQGKKIAIYIDGRQNYLSGTELKTYLQSQPASSVNVIEVLPNPSAKYDAQGGSVINIKSLANSKYGTNGSILLGAGQGKSFQNNQGISLNYRSKSVNVYGSYNHNDTKLHYDTYSDRVQNASLNIIDNEAKTRNTDSHSLKAGADFDLNKNNTIGFLAKANIMDVDRLSNGITALHYAGAPNDSTTQVNTTGGSHYVIPSFNMFFKSTLDTSNRTLAFNLDYFRYDKSSKNNYTTRFFDGNNAEYTPAQLLRDNSPTLNNVYAAALDFTNPLKNGSFEAGLKSYITKTDNNTLWELLQNNNWVYDNTRSNHFIYKEYINAIYANYNATFKKISLTAGLRYELTSTNGHLETNDTTTKRNYSNLFPSVNIEYKASDNHSIDFSYRKSIERFGFGVVNPFIFYVSPYEYSKGNPNIKPEISHSLKLTYTYKSMIDFSVNYTRANQALAPVYFRNGDVLISSQDNLSNSNTFYFSNDFYYTIKGFWDISLSNMAGFIQFNQIVDGKNILNNGTWVYQGSLSNSFNMGKGWSSELFATFLSPFSQGIYKTKSLFELDFGLSKSLLNNKANIRLSANDIFNSYSNRYTVNYQGVDAYFKEKDETRIFSLSFTYKFGNSKVKRSTSRQLNSDEIRSRMK
jgi:hypothetical protein